MGLSLPDKVSAFCRELDDGTLRESARRVGAEDEFDRAREAVRQGTINPALERDLDAVDRALRAVDGDGIYPPANRVFESWPGGLRDSGAQWWMCPQQRCAGRGRVVAGSPVPVCGALGRALHAGPLAP